MEKKYTLSHEWICLNEKVGTVGISEYAQKELGEIVYIELPSLGEEIIAGSALAVVESTKAASDVYSPIAGEVTESNEAIVSDPSLVNQDPEGNGWFFKVKVTNPEQINELMSKDDYDKFVTENA